MKQMPRRMIALVLALTALAAVLGHTETGPLTGRLAESILLWELPRQGDDLSPAALLTIRQSPLLLAARTAVFAAQTKEDSAPVQTDIATNVVAPAAPGALRETLSYQDNGVPSQTVCITNPAGYVAAGSVYIKNASDKKLDDVDLTSGSFDAALGDDPPQVLIMHTHGSEAYTMPKGEEYVSTGNYRTADNSCSVIRVGDEIAAALSAHGISVIHDRTLYDDPLYDGSYARSLAGIEAYREKYPSLTFVLDIHRDAVEDSKGRQYKLISREDAHAAQLSFVMGSGHDGWQENLKLAAAVANHIAASHPTVMRPITLRNSNYNQQVCSGSMLVEVGAAGNSLDEALHSARLFADAFAAAVQK